MLLQLYPKVHRRCSSLPVLGPDRLDTGSSSGKARRQFAVVDAGRTVSIYPRLSSLMPVGSLMRPGLRNDALIVYNCR